MVSAAAAQTPAAPQAGGSVSPTTPIAPSPSAAALDIETLTRNPAWWPKTVSLTRALSIPVTSNGQNSGQAQLPAQTAVRLIRVTGGQVEVEFLSQHFTAPFDSTDILARGTDLMRAANKVTRTPESAKSSIAESARPGNYREEAHEVMSDIQAKYWMPQAKRYAKKPDSKEADTVWGAGVMFSALVGAARNEPDHYKTLLNSFFEGLNGYWDSKAPVPGYEPAPTSGNGHDKYYDDNAWLAITFFEAYQLTYQQQYRRRAEETLDFVLSGWDDTVLNGGIWWHELHEKKSRGKNTCANAPTAVACLLSAKKPLHVAMTDSRIAWAKKITQWTTSNLQLENGLFADSIGMDGGMNRAQLTYNSALMLRANLGLYRATLDARYLTEAKRIGKAADGFMNSEKTAYRDAVKWSHLMVEADLALYRATHEEYLWERAKKNADHYYQQWKEHPPEDLISVASIARILWLMADQESDSGRKFWQNMERFGDF